MVLAMSKKSAFKIICNNSFYSYGVEVLVNHILKEYPFCLMEKVINDLIIPDIIIITENLMIDLVPFVNSLEKDKQYIVFCSSRVRRVLENIPGVNVVCFVRIEASCTEAERAIRETLFKYMSKTNHADMKINTSPSHLLTATQKEVVDLMANGLHPRQISKIYDMNIKKVSLLKRNAMTRLGVNTNQELIVKSLVLRETESAE